ncbi:MAG: hypothetical protein IJE73_02290 [Muribaculaceae bacterium]|nr:hypothetical protein [Muribaculaceae bacterium]
MKTITAQQLNAEFLKRKYAKLLQSNDVYPSRKNWKYIIENNMHELSDLLYRKYLLAINTPEEARSIYHNDTIEMFPQYLEYIDRRYAIATLYKDTSTNPSASIDLAINLHLFDIDGILDMLDRDEIRAAARMLMAMKPTYDANDLNDLLDLLDDFIELPDMGYYEGSRLGLISGSERYVCPNGHVNKDEVQYCTHPNCGLNIKGLTRTEVECIDTYTERLKILQELFSPKSASE